MKLKTIRTFLAMILSSSIIFSAIDVNCVGIDDSPNRKMLKAEIIHNAIKDLKEIEIIETFEDNENKAKEVMVTKVENKNSKSKILEKTKTVDNENKIEIDEKEDLTVSLGTFKLTAYCGCDKCCNQYATNRPVDENGNEIVYGSIGRVLTQGKSIAVDPNVIPYDTKVVINGNEYIAHDTGGAIKGNRIDVYFENHQDALDFGVQQSEVFIYNN